MVHVALNMIACQNTCIGYYSLSLSYMHLQVSSELETSLQVAGFKQCPLQLTDSMLSAGHFPDPKQCLDVAFTSLR